MSKSEYRSGRFVPQPLDPRLTPLSRARLKLTARRRAIERLIEANEEIAVAALELKREINAMLCELERQMRELGVKL